MISRNFMPVGHVSVRALAAATALLGVALPACADEMRAVKGLATPESVLVGSDGRLYVSEIGEFGKDGDGKVSVIGKSGTVEPFAKGMDDPKGLAAFKNTVYAADKVRVWKIDKQGNATVFAKAEDFPQPPMFLNDLVVDGKGNLYVSDSGDLEKGGKGAIFMITPAGKVSLVISEAQNASIKSPNGLLFERAGTMLVVDFASGELLRLDLGKGSVEKVADGFGGGDGLARDAAGVLYVSDWKNGRVWKLDLKKQGAKPEAYAQSFKSAADISLSRDGKFILVPDMKAGTLFWLPK
ncbi:SMP-30/gluconolactonase/LRE family protein [Variovorax sp. J22R133]|uniref:SMP-30/gluconolactonase/LRE family protein n=1 Tax=Variovorax brevis TaxID=3053503 RepID=UPI0025761058|nr:SMP-30/gluconolactonase/LRE family protein [Variovorax sp. J22R133]MDM0111321.1 SMP-30/gluconolactonase/LRE family protein [Variovorax sp. J22R133]